MINRLPTRVLDHNYKSPYFKIHSKEPNYQSLRVFGCQCFPLLRPYSAHKLEYHFKPCVFLGYNFAGYKFSDLITNKVYLSRHVIFDETSFPTKDMASSHLPTKINAKGDIVFSPYSPLPLTDFISPLALIAPTPDHTQNNGPLLILEIVASSPQPLAHSPPNVIHTSPPQQPIPVALDPPIAPTPDHTQNNGPLLIPKTIASSPQPLTFSFKCYSY
jgi:hypothetical protein